MRSRSGKREATSTVRRSATAVRAAATTSSRCRSCSSCCSGGRALADCRDALPQPVRPEPGGVDRLALLPAARGIAPDLVATRIPVVAEEVCRPFVAVQLEPRTAVALDRLARDDGGERARGVAKDDVRDVGIRRGDLEAAGFSRAARRRPPPRAPRPPGRAAPSGSSGCRCPPRREAPGRPLWYHAAQGEPALPYSAAGGVHAPDGAAAYLRPERAERRRELDEGRGDRSKPRSEASSASSSASLRLSASGFSTTTCLPCSRASRAISA